MKIEKVGDKLRVGLVFGGRSGEHEVSLQSAKSIYEALDKEKYEVVLVGIDKAGVWHLGVNEDRYWLDADDPSQISLDSSAPKVQPVGLGTKLQLQEVSGSNLSERVIAGVDVFFPIVHGTFGEDGSLQGWMEMLNVAYVGAGVLGSAVGMDKAVMKQLLRSSDISVGAYTVVKRAHRDNAEIEKWGMSLGLAQGRSLFVKPANLGSSVGVSKVSTLQELHQAVDEAFLYDTKILIEEEIVGREIECSVLGNDFPEASVAGEVIPNHEFYSYESKYLDEHGAGLVIPAEIGAEKMKEVQEVAIRSFQALRCSGMARVDMFLQQDGKLVMNEINTLPGFTSISMYPKLWEASGVPYSALLDRLIALAMERKEEQRSLKRDYL